MEHISNEEFRDEFNYFVSFFDPNTEEVMHICGYKNNPDVINLISLFGELKTDEEFGMDSDYVDSLKVRIFKKKDPN